MKHYRLNAMNRGWFVGNFSPTAYSTQAVEVAVKHYNVGDYDACHHHKVATEITLILSGHVEMNKKKYKDGDILVINPGESTDFRALSDAITVVVKIPGVLDDKYLD